MVSVLNDYCLILRRKEYLIFPYWFTAFIICSV